MRAAHVEEHIQNLLRLESRHEFQEGMEIQSGHHLRRGRAGGIAFAVKEAGHLQIFADLCSQDVARCGKTGPDRSPYMDIDPPWAMKDSPRMSKVKSHILSHNLFEDKSYTFYTSYIYLYHLIFDTSILISHN